MIKTKGKRVKEYLEYLREAYSEKPVKWWQSTVAEYITTKDFAEPPGYLPAVPDQTIIKYDLKRALKNSALFLCIIAGSQLVFLSTKGIKGDFIVFFMLTGCFIFYKPLSEIKRKPKLVLSREGIWFHDIAETILWNEVVASYIKVSEGDDKNTKFLNIHYYVQRYDIFYLAEIELNSLDIDVKTLSAEIEYRKQLAEV